MKNQIIGKLESEIATLKASKLTVKSESSFKNAKKTKNQFKKIIKEIKKQKLDLKNSIQKDFYLSEKFKEDLLYINSIELQSLNNKKTLEELSEINQKLKSILLNLQKNSDKSLCSEEQTFQAPKEIPKIEKQSQKTRKQIENKTPKKIVKQIRKQKLEFKKSFKEDNYLVQKYKKEFLFIESIEVQSLADNKTLEELSDLNEKLKSIILNLRDEQQQYTEASDSWTQTDFSPTISFDILNELNQISQLQYPAESHVETLTQKIALKEQENYDLMRERERSCKKFHSLIKTKKNLITLASPNKSDDAFIVVSQTYKLSRKNPDALMQSDIREFGSQTEISTLSIGVNFEEIIPTDDYLVQIKKLHGRLIQFSERKNNLTAESKRFICYCDSLDSGKNIDVIGCDLPDEIELDLRVDHFIVTTTVQIDEVKAYGQKLERFPKIFPRFEEDIKFVKSIKLSSMQKTTIRENFGMLQTLSERLTSIHQKLKTIIENIEKNKNKTVNDINRLISKVLKKKNSVLKTYSQEKFSILRNAFESEFDFVNSIKLSQQSDSSQEVINQEILNQEWKIIKKIDYKLIGLQEKFIKFCKEQSELILSDSRINMDGTGLENHQYTDMQQDRKKEMKSKDPGDNNISPSEYQLLLKERDDLIAEYLSVMDSNYVHMR